MTRLITNPSKAGAILLLILGFGLACLDLEAETPKYCDDIQCVERAIKHLLKDAPGRKLSRDPERQTELAKDILESSRAYRVPPLLTLAVAFRESSLKMNAVGKIQEKGIMQVHGRAARGCELKTQRGQIDCGVKYLRGRYDKCGGKRWYNAFSAYASGSCKPQTKITMEKVKSRLAFWGKLEGLK